ncbi:MAG: Mur ligase [Gammaproteobacteria bacterium]|nr:Mur ligase [Gammaproteobacteria bacterium]
MKLELDEARRLTGPNLLWDKPGAVVDVLLDEVAPQAVADAWRRWSVQLLEAFGWQAESTARLYPGGANLAIAAPMDALYTACEVAELIWQCAVAELQQVAVPDWQSRLNELHSELQEELNPRLMALISAATEHGVTCLVDDDELSLGMGASVDIWPVGELPAVSDVDWSKYRDVPRAFITGTNGKSTSVRLAAEIGSAAGFNAGVTSTDFIRVGDAIIDRGDYSGPGGARMLMRDRRTGIAFLEVARGGILRRGLPLDKVDAALVTNIAADHLGQYGINTVEDLAATKFVVARALDDDGVLVVNADNALVVQQAKTLDNTLCWFSLEEQNELVQAHIGSGQRAVFLRDGELVYHHAGDEHNYGAAADLPMTFGGTARHNIQNALGVIGLCHALGLPSEAIQAGLHKFGSTADDNPGRGNRYQLENCSVVVDFAHNEHSMRAVVDMVAHMPANKRLAMFGHAGDRADKEIQDLTNAVADLDASAYIINELEDYLRGRELGDIPALARDCLHARGVSDEQIHVVPDPLSGTKLALELAQEGDLLLLFVLDQREQVHQLLSELSLA